MGHKIQCGQKHDWNKDHNDRKNTDRRTDHTTMGRDKSRGSEHRGSTYALHERLHNLLRRILPLRTPLHQDILAQRIPLLDNRALQQSLIWVWQAVCSTRL